MGITAATPEGLLKMVGLQRIKNLIPTDATRTDYDHEILQGACDNANAIVESNVYIAYKPPLEVPITPALEFYANTIAKYILFSQVDKANAAIEKQHDDAIGWLKSVASKKVTLGGEPEQSMDSRALPQLTAIQVTETETYNSTDVTYPKIRRATMRRII